MNKQLLCFFLLLICASGSLAQQAPAIEWQKCYGGVYHDWGPNSIKQTTDGGFIIAGYTNSSDGDVSGNHGGEDYWIVKLDASGNVQWQKCLGGSGDEEPFSIQQTADGGFIIAGYTQSSDGDVSSGHGLSDYWIVKLDASGNMQWQKCLGGSGDDGASSIQQTVDGGFIVIGSTFSNSGEVSGNHGYSDLWVVKLDTSGNIQWQKCLGGGYYDYGSSFLQTPDLGFIVAGTSGSNDGDVSGNHGSNDYWIVKLDSSANIQWQKSLGGSRTDEAHSILQTDDGGFIVAGSSLSNEGDVSDHHGSDQDADAWIVKLDSSGNIQWQKSLGGSGGDEASSIIKSIDGGFIFGGGSGTNDGDVTINHGQGDCWIVKIDSSGNMIWQESFGGSGSDGAFDIQQTDDGGLIFGGPSQSNDGDVSGNHGDRDFWIVKLTKNFNAITGNIYIDANSNGVEDAGEFPLGDHKITEQNSGRFTFSYPTGFYRATVLDTGSFVVYPDTINYYHPLPANQSAYFSAMQQTDSLNDFAMQPAGVFNDLNIQITPMSAFRPGFDSYYSITYKNVGTTTLSPNVIFYPDNNLTFVSANVNPTSVTTDSVVWSLGPLAPFYAGSILVTVHVDTTALIGTLVTSGARIEPVTDDETPADNYSEWTNELTEGYDPNAMLVDRETMLTTELISPPYLDYLIYFQNTGNDTAFNISVRNKIPNTLDLSSFEFVASSNPVSISYSEYQHSVTFTFTNILLPDSTTNEPASHGFVRYRIKPLSTLVAGDSIKNTASIYFDFNAPVVTNTAVTAITLATVISKSEFQESISIYPNPSDGKFVIVNLTTPANQVTIRIYDLQGRRMNCEFRIDDFELNSIQLNTEKLPAGFYTLQIINNKTDESEVGKFVKGE